VTDPLALEAPAIWLRVRMPYELQRTTIETWLIELTGDGGVLRQIGLDAAGSVVYRCGPDEFGVWNDQVWIERYSPTSEAWSAVLGQDGGLISQEQFDAHWKQPRDIEHR
jgi:hypothetical protein